MCIEFGGFRQMTPRDALIALTNFGDLAVLIPVAIVVSIWLLHSQTRRDALWWGGAAALCMGATALLKIAFFVCPPADTLHSPSGHTSFSVLVYGGFGLFVAAKMEGWQRLAAVLGAIVVVGAIAASRVLLNSHTWVETVLGFTIGAGALGMLAARYLPNRRSDAPLRVLALAVVLVLVLFHGRQLHAESLLRAIGVELQSSGLACR